jgi:hypothetical protein
MVTSVGCVSIFFKPTYIGSHEKLLALIAGPVIRSPSNEQLMRQMIIKQQTPEEAANHFMLHYANYGFYDPNLCHHDSFLAGVSWGRENPKWRTGEPEESGWYLVSLNVANGPYVAFDRWVEGEWLEHYPQYIYGWVPFPKAAEVAVAA